MNSFSLKTKIFSLAGVLLFLLAVVGTVSYFVSKRIVSEYSKLNDQALPKTKNLLEAVGFFRSARIEILNLSAPGRTAEQNKTALKRINDVWASFDKSVEAYKAVESTDSEKQNFKEYIDQVDTVRGDFKKAIDLFNKNPDENSAERKEMLKIVLDDIVAHGLNTRKEINELLDENTAASTVASNNAKAADRLGTQLIIGLTALSFILGFGFAFLLARSLVNKFSSISTILSNSANRVASASSQIAASSQGLSQSSTEQAASLQQTAASLEEITSMISKAAESAGTTESSSNQSQEKAIEGQKAVEHMLISMDEISESNTNIMTQVNHSNEQMSEIVRVIQVIGNKTKVINDIVFQTKLLSFNASVEAARAGEHGKGFSVVAEEVGNLAQMSGNAAKEISDMLDTSISKVQAIVRDTKTNVESLVEKGKHKVASGVTVARECSDILNEIVQNISTVTVLSKEISQATKEQSQGVGEINKAMGQLDSTTQQNSSASEETANAATELSAQAESLKTAVDDLVAIVQGKVA